MKRYVICFFLFLFFCFYSCESYYDPEIEQYPNALVVEGMLTDQNGFALIKLSRSKPYNNQSYYYGEKKAKVTVESESGLVYPTTELSRGVYQTNEQVPTIAGEGYFVRIITEGKLEYRSKIEKMMSNTPIDSIYLTDSIFKDISYDYWGDPVVKDYGGITFSIIPHEPANSDVGFLYKWNALVNYYVFSSLSIPMSPPIENHYYCWKHLSSTMIYVYEYVHDDFIVQLPMADLHSLSFYTLSPLPLDSSRFEGAVSQSYSTSLYYHLRQYTITRDGSKFWRSVKNQGEASGKLFDPVEEQIIGNIVCVSDPNLVAFGYFNTAAFSDRVICVKLKSDRHGGYRKVEMVPETPSEEDCFLGEIPEFWF